MFCVADTSSISVCSMVYGTTTKHFRGLSTHVGHLYLQFIRSILCVHCIDCVINPYMCEFFIWPFGTTVWVAKGELRRRMRGEVGRKRLHKM